MPDFSFSNGKSAVLDCKIEYGNKKEENFETTNPTGMELEAATRELDIKPEGVARISGRATQFRRVNDFVFETFLTPAINPEIEVIMPDGFDHIVKFGTIGDYTREAYADRYTLSGVYFPGQFMFVRWLPRFR